MRGWAGSRSSRRRALHSIAYSHCSPSRSTSPGRDGTIGPVMRATDLDRLVARAQRGDSAALEEVCARARPMLQRHARRVLGGSSADVEDAVQDALILACARIGTYRWEG